MGLKKCWLETIKGNSLLFAIDFQNKIFNLTTQNFAWTIVGWIKRLGYSIMTNKDMGASGEICLAHGMLEIVDEEKLYEVGACTMTADQHKLLGPVACQSKRE